MKPGELPPFAQKKTPSPFFTWALFVFIGLGLVIYTSLAVAWYKESAPPPLGHTDPMLAGDFHLHRVAGPMHQNGYIELWTFGDSTIVEVEFQPHYHTDARAALAEGECGSENIHRVIEFNASPPDPDSPQWGGKVNLSVNQLLDHGYSAVLYDRKSGSLTWCGEIARSNQMLQPTLTP
jgi:hypothetical protein